MTRKQKILKALYPLMIGFNKLSGSRSTILANKKRLSPPVSFYQLRATGHDGREITFESLKGKKVLIVNTASNCVYTTQYDGLQQLYKKYAGRLVIIGFPSNDFSGQEPGTNQQIAAFCRENFSINFPMAAKTSVVKGPGQNGVFKWLTHQSENGWNDEVPSWNFGKYLVDEKGMLTHYFDPAIEPGDAAIVEAISR